MITANDIAKKLSDRAEEVVRYLFPQGKRIGKEWCVGALSGESGESLKVCMTGDKKGVWCDFATDHSGDLLDLWAQSKQIKLADAIIEAGRWLSIAVPHFAAHKPNIYSKPNISKINSTQLTSAVQDYLLGQRKLSLSTLHQFDIRANNHEIIFPYWRENELLQIKYIGLHRPEGKKIIRVEANCEPSLFGWQALPANVRQVALTEGEIDTMTLHQYGIPALSLPFGGGGGNKHRWLENEYERLARFDIIYLCLDQDSTGQQAMEALVNRLGLHRCRIVTLPCKDANECLQQGLTAEQMQQYFKQATTRDPVELKPANHFAEQVVSAFFPLEGEEPGINPPWNKAQHKIKFRPGELSVWTGINGHGKSQFLGNIILSAMQQGARICVASLELSPARLLMRLTRQAAALKEPSPDYIRAIHNWYEDKLWLFDVVGSTKLERLLEVFVYAVQRYGIDVFVIDSMMKCGLAEDDFNAQKLFVERLCDFKNQYQCHIHLITHPRKSSDELKPPNKLDIKGAGAIGDLADNCFIVWRNKPKEQQIQQLLAKNQQVSEDLLNQPDCLWICDKQRNGDWEGKISLWFDAVSYQYFNHQNTRPTQYVQYSKI